MVQPWYGQFKLHLRQTILLQLQEKISLQSSLDREWTWYLGDEVLGTLTWCKDPDRLEKDHRFPTAPYLCVREGPLIAKQWGIFSDLVITLFVLASRAPSKVHQLPTSPRSAHCAFVRTCVETITLLEYQRFYNRCGTTISVIITTATRSPLLGNVHMKAPTKI